MNAQSSSAAVLSRPSYDDDKARQAQRDRLLALVADREAAHGVVPQALTVHVDKRAEAWPA